MAKKKPQYAKNTSGNAYSGQTYAIKPAPGGVYHIYNDGRKVFMPSGKTAAPRPAAPRPPAPRPVPAGSGAPASAGTTNNPHAGELAPDSQFFDAEANQAFDVEQTRARNLAAEEAARARYGEAIRRLQEQRPVDQRNLAQNANAQGLFYSGHHAEGLNNLAIEYARRQADLRGQLDDELSDRQLQGAAVGQGANITSARNLEDAAGRQITRDSDAAAAGALVLNPAVTVPPKPVAARRSPQRRRPEPVGNLVLVRPKGSKKRRQGAMVRVPRTRKS